MDDDDVMYLYLYKCMYKQFCYIIIYIILLRVSCRRLLKIKGRMYII